MYRRSRTKRCTPGEKLFDLADRVWKKIRDTVDPYNDGPWAPLSPSQQEEMDGAIVMFQEAMDQVSAVLGAWRGGAMQTSRSPLTLLNDTPLLTGPHRSSAGHR